jgi:hypothetical protein
MSRVAVSSIAALLLLAACAPVAPAPPVSVAGRVAPPRAVGPAGEPLSHDALVAACRREAERVVLYRDRGQEMRIDEGQSRVGVQASIPTIRAETDRLAQQFERDRLTEECVRRHLGEEPLGRGGAAAVPSPAPTRGRATGGGS